MRRKFQGPARSEGERQALISELRRLRAAGVNVDRQEAILSTLREQFELGWPEKMPQHRRREYAARSNGVAS